MPRIPKKDVKATALKREHPVLQYIKISKFLSNFVGHFCPPGSGSGSTDLIESYPDAKHYSDSLKNSVSDSVPDHLQPQV